MSSGTRIRLAVISCRTPRASRSFAQNTAVGRCRARSWRADSFLMKPSCLIASPTRLRVGSATMSGRFSTLETVPTETPACAATSLRLAGASATVTSPDVVQVCGARLERVKQPGLASAGPGRPGPLPRGGQAGVTIQRRIRPSRASSPDDRRYPGCGPSGGLAEVQGQGRGDRPGHPDSLKKYVADGTVQAFELWNPANLGYLAGRVGGPAPRSPAAARLSPGRPAGRRGRGRGPRTARGPPRP